ERDVLALMAEGRSNAAIAATLVVTERAVEKHIGNIFAKLGLPPSDADHRRGPPGPRYPPSPHRARTPAEKPAAGAAPHPRHTPPPPPYTAAALMAGVTTGRPPIPRGVTALPFPRGRRRRPARGRGHHRPPRHHRTSVAVTSGPSCRSATPRRCLPRQPSGGR